MLDKNLLGWHFNNNMLRILHLCHNFDWLWLWLTLFLVFSYYQLYKAANWKMYRYNGIQTAAFLKFMKLFSNYTTAISDWYQIIYSGVKHIEEQKTVKSYWITRSGKWHFATLQWWNLIPSFISICHWYCKQILEPLSLFISCTF